MLLSDRDIKAEVNAGRIGLEPYAVDMVQPSSIDVRLDRYFRVFENHRYPHIDPSADQSELTRVGVLIVSLPLITAWVVGRNRYRLALVRTVTPQLVAAGQPARVTAGFIDPGFSGHVTLELSNVATLPIKLWPGMKIGQLCFFRLTTAAEHPYGSAQYGSHYQGQRGPKPSKSHLNFHRTRI